MEIWGLVILVLTVCDVTHGSKFASCFDEKKSFKYDALTQYFTHLKTPEECQAACRHDCEGFTWITDLTPVIPNICALFDTDTPSYAIEYEDEVCEECLSGPKACPCTFQGECDMTVSNVVDVQLEVKDAACCQDLCNIYNNLGCKYFTFYNETHDFPKTCFLFSTCDKVNNGCDACQYGEKGCTVCSWEDTQSGVCGPNSGVRDHLLVLGGKTISGESASVEYLAFAGSESCDSPVSDLPAVVQDHSTVITRTARIVSCGGENSTGPTSDCWTWTKASQSWTPAPALPEALKDGQMVYLLRPDVILFIGGRDDSNIIRNEIYQIDSELTGQWTKVATLVTPREKHCSAAYDDYIVTSGGDNGGQVVTVEVYRVGEATSTTLDSDLQQGRFIHGCSLFNNTNGDVQYVVTGGENTAGDRFDSVEIATKTGTTWSAFTKTENALPEPRWRHTTTKIGDYLVTVGGGTDNDNPDTPSGSIVVSDDEGTTWTTSGIGLTTDRMGYSAVPTTDWC